MNIKYPLVVTMFICLLSSSCLAASKNDATTEELRLISKIGQQVLLQGLQGASGKHYYFRKKDGSMVKNRWILDGKHRYYAGKDGRLSSKTFKPKPDPRRKAPLSAAPQKARSRAEIIASTAEGLAWPVGTSKRKWRYHYARSHSFQSWNQLGHSRPTKAFIHSYDRYYSHHWREGMGYGGGPRVGASCDRFVGTVIRASGLDRACPMGVSSQKRHFKRSSLWRIVKIRGKSDLKRGDVINYSNHTLIYLGKEKVAEAALNYSFGHVEHIQKKNYRRKGRKWYYVFRIRES